MESSRAAGMMAIPEFLRAGLEALLIIINWRFLHGSGGRSYERGVRLKIQADKKTMLYRHSHALARQKLSVAMRKGRCGYVTGKHGGIDHVMVYFDEETLDLMTCDDKVLIKACDRD